MATTPHMSAAEFYRRVWIKEDGSDPRGDWPIRMAEAYAAFQTARADRAEQERNEFKEAAYRLENTIRLLRTESKFAEKETSMTILNPQTVHCPKCGHAFPASFATKEKAIAAAMEKITASL